MSGWIFVDSAKGISMKVDSKSTVELTVYSDKVQGDIKFQGLCGNLNRDPSGERISPLTRTHPSHILLSLILIITFVMWIKKNQKFILQFQCVDFKATKLYIINILDIRQLKIRSLFHNQFWFKSNFKWFLFS